MGQGAKFPGAIENPRVGSSILSLAPLFLTDSNATNNKFVRGEIWG